MPQVLRSCAAVVCLSLAFLVPLPAQAQESAFALQFLGISEETGDARARGLGLDGVALGDAHTAITLNPASLGALQEMTLSAMGVAGVRSAHDGSVDESFGMARFPHARAALPIFGKVVLSVGFVGFRNFRSDFRLAENTDSGGFRHDDTFQRDGTLYTIPFGVAGTLGPHVYLGATLDLLQGSLREAWVTDSPEDTVVSVTRRLDTMSGRTVTLGAVLVPDDRVRLGISWSPQFTGNRSRETLVTVAARNFSREESSVLREDVQLPQALRLGAALLPVPGWLLSGDWSWREWEVYDGNVYEARGVRNEVRWGLGVERQRPGGRLAWRAGYSRHAWPQRTGEDLVDEQAVHFGLGVDIAAAGGRLDLGLERAWIGDLDRNGLEESVWRVVVGISGQERWVRRSPRR